MMLASRAWLLGGMLAAVAAACSKGVPTRADAAVPGPLAARHPVEVEKAGRPVSEVLAALSRQASLKLTAATELAPQKVTVLFRAMPLDEALRSLSAAVDGVWKAHPPPDGGAIEYRLEPSERRKSRLDHYRRQREAAASERDDAALAALMDNLHGRERKPAPDDANAASRMAANLQPTQLYGLVRELPESILRQMISQANEAFPTMTGMLSERSPAVILPATALSSTRRRQLSHFLEALADEAQRRGAPSRAEACRRIARQPEILRLEFWALRYDLAGGLAVVAHLRLQAPDGVWRQDCFLTGAVSKPLPDRLEDPRQLAPPDARFTDPTEEMKLDVGYGPSRMDRGLIEIARAAGVNLAADYYTKPGALDLQTRAHPLGDLLKQAETLHRMAHFWTGKSLIVRARDWPLAFDREPAAAVLDRWDRRKEEQKPLTLDDYVEAATRLTDAQIVTVSNHSDERAQRLHRFEVKPLAQLRHVLRGYAELNGLQRTAIAGPQGMAVASLSKEQSQSWGPVLRRLAVFPPEAVQRTRIRMIMGRIQPGPVATPDALLPTFVMLGLPGAPLLDLVGDVGF
jgi:hypothetical protein